MHICTCMLWWRQPSAPILLEGQLSSRLASISISNVRASFDSLALHYHTGNGWGLRPVPLTRHWKVDLNAAWLAWSVFWDDGWCELFWRRLAKISTGKNTGIPAPRWIKCQPLETARFQFCSFMSILCLELNLLTGKPCYLEVSSGGEYSLRISWLSITMFCYIGKGIWGTWGILVFGEKESLSWFKFRRLAVPRQAFLIQVLMPACW